MKIRSTRTLLFVLLLVLTIPRSGLSAQDILALKTNLLYGAGALTPNLSLEVGLNDRVTFEFTGAYNGWNIDGSATDNKKIAHWLVRPEVRYWFCERYVGHFMGIHPFYGRYNIAGKKIPLLLEKGSEDHRYKGYIGGIGIGYGYDFVLNRSFNLEFNVGVGYGYMKYNKMQCERCGESIGRYDRHYFGPTRAGITLVYLIK